MGLRLWRIALMGVFLLFGAAQGGATANDDPNFATWTEGLRLLDIPSQRQQGVDLIRQAAEAGVPNAQYMLGLMNERGRYIPQNAKRAVEWYRKAADQGYEWGQFQLAETYAEGKLVTQDLEKAFDLYFAAADKGHTPSIRKVGEGYLFGRGVKQDAEEATKYLEAAARTGDNSAAWLLGVGFFRGDQGVKIDRPKGLKWLTVAAKGGVVEAQTFLGAEIIKSATTSSRLDEGEKWLRLAAGQDYAPAHIGLMKLYANPDYGKVDEKMARQHLMAAANLGDPTGELNLGLAYESGQFGVPRNQEKSNLWLLRSAQKGNPRAMYHYAVNVGSGTGMKQDMLAGFEWTQKAADLGYPKAQAFLARLLYAGIKNGQPDKAAAMALLEKVAASGSPTARDIADGKMPFDAQAAEKMERELDALE